MKSPKTDLPTGITKIGLLTIQSLVCCEDFEDKLRIDRKLKNLKSLRQKVIMVR